MSLRFSNGMTKCIVGHSVTTKNQNKEEKEIFDKTYLTSIAGPRHIS